MGFVPEYKDLENFDLKGEEEVDGALLIGDHALEFKNPSYPYCYDIGELWREKTSFPVVFAVWAVRKDFADKWPDKVHMVEKNTEEIL